MRRARRRSTALRNTATPRRDHPAGTPRLETQPAEPCGHSTTRALRCTGRLGVCPATMPIGSCAAAGSTSLHVRPALADLVEKPHPPFSLVQDLLQDVPRRRVTVLVAHLDRVALLLGDVTVVLDQARDHLLGRHALLVVIANGLKLADMRDAPDGRSADLSYTLGEQVDRAEDGLGMLIEQQVIVAEVRSVDMPVKVFQLDVHGKGIGNQRIDSGGDGLDLLVLQVGRRREWLGRSGLYRTYGHCRSPLSWG